MSFLLALFLTLVATTLPPAVTNSKTGRTTWAIHSAGTTTILTSLGGEQLTVTIHTWQVPVHAGPLSTPRPYTECTYSQNPCSITDRLQVHLGGKLLGVGPFEIAGLGDMHILSVEGSPARLVLVIGGGDGASSYNAHLIFGRTHVAERTLFAGFDPAHPFEVTHYFYQTIP